MKKKSLFALLFLPLALSSCEGFDYSVYPTTVFRPEYYDYRIYVFYGLLALGTLNLIGGIIFRLACDKTVFKKAHIPASASIIAAVIQFLIGVAVCLVGIFVKEGIVHYMALFYSWVILTPLTIWVRQSTGAFHKSLSFWFYYIGVLTVSFVLGFLFFSNPWISVLYAFAPFNILFVWAEGRKEKFKQAMATMGLQIGLNLFCFVTCGWIVFACYPNQIAFIILYIVHVLVVGFMGIFIH